MTEKKNGAGNWIVRSLNGVGLLVVMGVLVSAVAAGAIKWNEMTRLEKNVVAYCLEQEGKWETQQQLDRQQNKEVQAYNEQWDKTFQMYTEKLIRIEGKQDGMKEQLDEIKALLRKQPQ